MKKAAVLILCLSLYVLTSLGCGGGGGGGQSVTSTIENFWAFTFGTTGQDSASAILQTNDNGYIVVGQTGLSTPGTGDILGIKLNDNGVVQLYYAYDTGSTEEAYDIKRSYDGRYTILGVRSYIGLMINLNTDGSVNWGKTYSESTGQETFLNSFDTTNDNGYVSCGIVDSGVGTQDWDGLIIKLDSSGNMLWSKKYPGIAYDSLNYINQTTDNGYIVIGTTSSYGAGGYDIWIMKTDNSGNMIWQKTYGGPSGDYGQQIKQTNDGGFILIGNTLSYSLGNNYDVWVIKIDGNGNLQWQKIFAGQYYDEVKSINLTSEDGYIICGISQSFGSTDGDSWLFKLDRDGNIIWQKNYGGSGSDYLFDVHEVRDGGYIATGKTVSYGAGSSDYIIIKTKNNGTVPPFGTSITIAPSSYIPSISNSYHVPVNANIQSQVISVNVSQPTLYYTQLAP